MKADIFNLETILNNFHFIRPEYLWGLVVLLIILFALKIFQLYSNLILKKFSESSSINTYDGWQQYCNQNILKKLYILPHNNDKHHKEKNYNSILYIIWILAIIALAGPSWIKDEIPVYQNQDSWLIALSLSKSMQETDITPSRLQRAKYKINDFLNYTKDEQVGLITFTDRAYDLIPLTTDKKTIEHILPSIDPLIMPSQGNDINAALEKAETLTSNLKLKSSNILILTDGLANSESILKAKNLSDNNIGIYIINFNKNNITKSTNSLKELSNLSNGIYQDYSNNDRDLKNIIAHAEARYNKLNAQYEKYNKDEENNNLTALWLDMGPYLLLLILPLLLFYILANNYNSNVTRRISFINYLVHPMLSLLLIIFLLGFNNQIILANNIWNKIWFNKQQLAADALKNNKPRDISPDDFYNQDWQAVANYKNNNFDKSAEILKNKEDLISQYNYANSLAKQGKVIEALETYNKILEQSPEHEDAKFNKKLIEDYLKSQQNNQNQDNQQDQAQNQQKNQDQQNQNKDKQNQDQQQSQASSKQYENKDDNKDDNKQASNNQNQDENQDEQQDQAGNNQKNNQDEPDEDKKSNMASNNNKEIEEENNEKQQGNDELSKEDLKQAKSDNELKKWINKIPDNPAIYLKNQLQYEYWKEQQNIN